jgi:hypothetical protein
MTDPTPRPWWVRLLRGLVGLLAWLVFGRRPGQCPGDRPADKPTKKDDDPPKPGPLVPLLALLLAGSAVLAAPVPVPEPIEGRGNRGLPELRGPAGAAYDLSVLLRSCARCHGETGPNKPLFDARKQLNGAVPLERLGWGTGIVVRSQPGATWYPTDEERPALERALRLLPRPKP